MTEEIKAGKEMTYKEKRDEIVVMISFNRDDLGRTIISGLTTEFLEWHEKQLKAEYNQALEDMKSKVQDIQSNSSDNDDEWFALQSVLEQIEILQLKK